MNAVQCFQTPMPRLSLALLLVLFACPSAASAANLKLADVRLLEGAAPVVEAFLARPGLSYEPEPARLDRHGRRLAHVFSGPLWLQRELVARGLAIVAPPLVSRERAQALLALERRARISEPGLWTRIEARVVAADRAAQLGLTPLARFVAFTTAGVKPELFGLGPVPAVRKALRLAGLSLADIDLVELNEAFAAQVLACLQELPIDPDVLNVNGGAIALGHPLGCTGAKLTATLLHELRRRNGRYGLVTMCVGGGMGAAGIFERL